MPMTSMRVYDFIIFESFSIGNVIPALRKMEGNEKDYHKFEGHDRNINLIMKETERRA